VGTTLEQLEAAQAERKRGMKAKEAGFTREMAAREIERKRVEELKLRNPGPNTR